MCSLPATLPVGANGLMVNVRLSEYDPGEADDDDDVWPARGQQLLSDRERKASVRAVRFSELNKSWSGKTIRGLHEIANADGSRHSVGGCSSTTSCTTFTFTFTCSL